MMIVPMHNSKMSRDRH